MFEQFFVVDVDPNKLIIGSYDIWLVILSIFLASMASFFALRLAATARYIEMKKHRHIALIVGAIVMAGGIWSMHFVGMLAFAMPHKMDYNHVITALSFLPAVLASYFVLKSLINQTDSFKTTLKNGVIVGVGIGAMHYVGMSAMQMDLQLRYDPVWFVLSIIVSVVLATVALSARSQLVRRFTLLSSLHVKLVSAFIMGCAISGMHYTGMKAALFIDLVECSTPLATEQDHQTLAVIVSIFTLLISTLAVNVSAQLRYRQLLREKTAGEARLQAILDTAADGVITINSKGIVQGINSSACEIFGWQEHEIVGRNVSMLMPADEQSRHDDYLQSYIDTGRTQVIGAPRELYAQHRNGKLIPVRLAVGKVSLEGGDTLFVGFISDISERKAMEEKLRESEQRLTTLMQNIPGASFRRLLDHNWTPVFLSDGILELTGYNPEDFLSGHVSFANCVVEGQDICSNIRTNLGERDTYEIEYRLIHKDGHTVWVLENGMIVRDSEQKPLWADGVMVDISSRKVIECELVDAKQKAEYAADSKASFLANMSHEIRTPMNAILGFTDLLLDSDIRGDNRKYLQTISQSSRSLLHLLNDILDSAKLEKNKLELEVVPFKLSACVDTVVSTLWLSAKNKDIELTLTMSKHLPKVVEGSEDRIRQVLMNLVGNGIKFTEKGYVSLTVEPVEHKPEWIRFSVEDTGIGIEPSRLKSIFEPFTQADASMSRRFGGTGLGTTISQQLVELMGGQITATSELGKGSCFNVELPLKPSEITAPIVSSQIVELPRLKVLVCDDIEQNINLLRILLERHHHTVFTAQDGLEAVSRYKDVKPDIVLMDIQMPNLDGLAASMQIRQWEQQQGLTRTPIVALTASVLVEDRIQAREAGMNGFANKPVDFAQLTQEMASVLNIAVNPTDPIISQLGGLNQTSLTIINIDKAVKLWGDKALYVDELTKFITQNQNVIETFKQLLNSKQWAKLGERVHALKGLVGNFALLPLFHCFSDLEKAVDGHMPALAQNAVEAAEQHWTILEKELKQISNEVISSQPLESNLHLDTEEVVHMLQEWLDATLSGELKDDLALQLKQGAPDLAKKPIADAINAIEEFDFDAASDFIRQAMTSLK